MYAYNAHALRLYATISDILLVDLTAGQPPSWSTGTSFSKTSSECTSITTLFASSVTGDTVEYR